MVHYTTPLAKNWVGFLRSDDDGNREKRNMKFHRTDDILGCSLKGFVRVTYAKLVQTFGEPEYWNEENPAVWSVEFDDATKATVYVHKPAECGLRPGEIPTKEFRWHVGGLSRDAVVRVAEALDTEPIFWEDVFFWDS
jgi:hypothetical protein